MNELKNLLLNVSDSYYDFVIAIMQYAKKKPERLSRVCNYIKEHPGADTSAIIGFVSDQPDFFEDNTGANEYSKAV